jgi:hypothetical protein
MLDTSDRQTIIYLVQQKFPDVIVRTIDGDCARIREAWLAKAAPKDILEARAQQLAKIEDESKFFKKRKAYGAMAAHRRLAVEVLGVKAPEQLQIQTVCQACVDRADIEKRQVEGFERLTPEEQAEYERLVNKMLGNVTIRLLTEGE